MRMRLLKPVGFLALLAFLGAFFLLVEPAAHSHKGDTSRGKDLYKANCAECHGENGEGRKKEEAPAVGNDDFLKVASDTFLKNAILKGRPGTKMQAWESKLKEADVHAIVAFIRSLQKTKSPSNLPARLEGGNVVKGKALFEMNCAQCHGDSGEGGKGPALHHPEFLRDASDGFLYVTISQGRKGTPMDAWSTQHGGKLTPEQIKDIVTFIRSWEKK